MFCNIDSKIINSFLPSPSAILISRFFTPSLRILESKFITLSALLKIANRDSKLRGLKTRICTLDRKALLMLNPGFSVVAPISVINPIQYAGAKHLVAL